MKKGLLAVSSAPAGPLGAEAEEENYSTGDASLDNIRNQDNIGERELLAVSFGTSYNDSRRLTIGAIEEEMERAFPEFSVRRAFTSQIILNHVRSRDGISMDNVKEALARAADNGVKTLVIQPTHLMNGLEYHDLVAEAAGHVELFEQVVIGEPLLTSERDFQLVMEAVTEASAVYDDPDTAICLMGHGTESAANQVYERLENMLRRAGRSNYYVGTVEANPGLEDVLTAVRRGVYRRVILMPLMVVAGDHVNNDMAGDGEDSWKTAVEEAGYEVTCLMQGLGELEKIRRLFVDHARAAMDRL